MARVIEEDPLEPDVALDNARILQWLGLDDDALRLAAKAVSSIHSSGSDGCVPGILPRDPRPTR